MISRIRNRYHKMGTNKNVHHVNNSINKSSDLEEERRRR